MSTEAWHLRLASTQHVSHTKRIATRPQGGYFRKLLHAVRPPGNRPSHDRPSIIQGLCGRLVLFSGRASRSRMPTSPRQSSPHMAPIGASTPSTIDPAQIRCAILPSASERAMLPQLPDISKRCRPKRPAPSAETCPGKVTMSHACVRGGAAAPAPVSRLRAADILVRGRSLAFALIAAARFSTAFFNWSRSSAAKVFAKVTSSNAKCYLISDFSCNRSSKQKRSFTRGLEKPSGLTNC